jgi:hypothetical protein
VRDGRRPEWEDGRLADGPAAPLSGVGEHRLELGKEALTMALYVAILISLIGFAVARDAGASLSRAVVYSLFVLVCAVVIAALKNLLAGH